MAGLGSPHSIWHWPLHYYFTIRREYLKIINPQTRRDGDGANGEHVTSRRTVGPGIEIQTIERPG